MKPICVNCTNVCAAESIDGVSSNHTLVYH